MQPSAAHIRKACLIIGLAAVISLPDFTDTTAQPGDDGIDLGYLITFLRAMPVLLEGQLLAVDTLEARSMIGGCGGGPMPQGKSLDLHVRVRRVFHGTADDSVAVVATLGIDQFLPGEIDIGSRVLVWGYRECYDAWRFWGNMVAISADGNLLGSLQTTVGRFQPIAYKTVDSALTSGTAESPYAMFNGATGVALVRARDAFLAGSGRIAYPLDSLSVALGRVDRVPRYLKMTARLDHCLYFLAGDSLILPIRPGNVSDTITIAACPVALPTKNSFAPALGTSVGSLGRSLKLSPTISVRPVVSAD